MGSSFPIGFPGSAMNIAGGTFIGTFLTATCFGAISVQLIRYFDVFRRDARSTRVVVAFLWLVEGFQSACVTRSMWYYFVKNFGAPLIAEKGIWELLFYQTGSVISSATVQTFFAYRVYSLSNSKVLGILVELFAVVQCAFGLAVSITAFRTPIPPIFVREYKWLVLTWLACQATADLVICSSMVPLLRARRTGFKNTEKALNLMTLWTINTGVVSALLSLVILVAFAKDGFNYLVLSLGIPHGGFYTFTMMANLHSRTQVAKKWNGPQSIPSVSQSWPMTHLVARQSNDVRHRDIDTHSTQIFDTCDPHVTNAPVIIDVVEECEIIDENGTRYNYPHLPAKTTTHDFEFDSSPPPTTRKPKTYI